MAIVEELVKDESGRIHVSEALAERLGLEPGMWLIVEDDAEGVSLRPTEEPAVLVEKDGVLVAKVDLPEGWEDPVKADREVRMRKLMGNLGP